MQSLKGKKRIFGLRESFSYLACAAVFTVCAILVGFFSKELTYDILTENAINVNSGVGEKSERVIILDPGHGGLDSGAVGLSGTLEKELNLDIAMKVRDILVFNGYTVVMTRTDDSMYYDENLSLSKKVQDTRHRVEMMDEYENCIFVSIHLNKFVSEKYSGLQVYYSPNVSESFDIAKGIQTYAKDLLQKDNDRKVKKSNATIYVLDKATVPAVLVECGFLSNVAEEKKLCDENYRKDIASVLFLALDCYLSGEKYEK